MNKTDNFIVIDICTNSLSPDSKIISFAALRFENGVPTERFFEYVNSGAALSDSGYEILGITNDTLKSYGTTMEDAYWQLIEFCCDSELLTAHYNCDMKAIERICKKYDLPMLTNHITDLEALFRMKFFRGYSTSIAEKLLGISTDEEADWRHLDIAGKAYIELQGSQSQKRYY